MTARQLDATVLSRTPTGAYHLITLHAPHIAAEARPGHFVALTVGGPQTSMLLRRAFAIYTADRDNGAVQIVVAEHGPGTAWLVRVRTDDVLNVLGPLGRPFTMPAPGSAAILVAGGYGSAPLFDLARQLRATGCPVHLILGAATADRLFGVSEAGEVADSVSVTTDDGSTGAHGRVTDGLSELITTTEAATVYACGPMAMLRAVGHLAADHKIPAQVAVEESMACGIGVCMTCVLPVIGGDGRTRMVRACIEGPVFDAAALRWADVGRLPDDIVGAEAMVAH